MDKMKFTFIDLFAGIGGFHSAAKQLGGKCLFASEIDMHASLSYEHNYKIKPHGDITKIESSEIPEHDILFAGFPCQPFSIIGSRLGFDDIRGTLFFEIARILQDKKPSCFLLENVKQLSSHNKGNALKVILTVLNDLGYKVQWKILNALDFGVPQKRERIVIVGFLDHNINFRFPSAGENTVTLPQILEDEASVDQKHFASEHIYKKRAASHISNYSPSIWHENKSGNITSYPYSCALRAGASYNYLLVNGKRRLTSRELLRLQGFPNSFEIVCSDGQTRKQAGNTVPVPMIKAVIKEMLNAKTEVKRQ